MIKYNQYFKNAHNTKKSFKNITDAPDGDDKTISDDDADDATNTDDDDAGSTDSKTPPYSLRNRNHSPNAADNYAVSPDDDASPDSFIDSKLKLKVDPRSMIKQKK